MLIPLTKGKVAIIDDEDYELLSKYKWHVTSSGYARRSYYDKQNKKILYEHMHRFLLSEPKGICDHINGDSLDNRKSNLRVATQRENNINSRSRKGSSSIYKGVTYCRYHKKWKTAIKYDGKVRHIGYFTEEKEAAKAYNKVASKHFGEFAKLNKIV